jgi:hypothetical protein
VILDTPETLELFYGDLRVKPEATESQFYGRPIQEFLDTPAPKELKSSAHYVFWGVLVAASSVGILIAWLIDCFRR